MHKLIATIEKELLLLVRDRSGLLVLFLMPAVLVLVVSLVQENVMKLTGETGIRVLLVDNDNSVIGKTIEERLSESDAFEVVKQIDGRAADEKTAKAAIANGDFQFCVIIPEGTWKAVEIKARRMVENAFSPAGEPEKSSGESDLPLPGLSIHFDPTVRGSFRSAVVNALQRIILGLEIETKIGMFAEIFPKQLGSYMESVAGPGAAESFGPLPEMKTDWGRDPLVLLNEDTEKNDGFLPPTSVQQNVPAWALFGMFFIVVPLSGSLIKERRDGAMARLLTIPAPYILILSGKIVAFVLVCLIQFALILAMGKYLLPLLGAPVLETGAAPLAVLAVSFACALAASGYGVMIGTVCGTYEQASMFGPVSVVIAAALGGIMVPVYVMPEIMRKISMFSPLAWGLNAFLDIFVRGGGIRSVLSEIFSLLAFFGGTVFIAWVFFFRRIRTG